MRSRRSNQCEVPRPRWVSRPSQFFFLGKLAAQHDKRTADFAKGLAVIFAEVGELF